MDSFHFIADPVGFKKDLLNQKAALGGLDSLDDMPGRREEAVSEVRDVPDLIGDLDDLRKRGLLTDAEFEEKKRRLLDRI